MIKCISLPLLTVFNRTVLQSERGITPIANINRFQCLIRS